MTGRAPLPTIVLLVVAIAAAAWLFYGLLSDASEPAGSVDVAGPAPIARDPEPAEPRGADPKPLERPRPPDPAPEPSSPVGPTPEVAPELPTPKPLETFTIESATWKDAPVLEVLEDVARRAGHVLRVSSGTRRMLAGEKVTLTVENEKAHRVVGRVILKYDLDFAVRGNKLRVFVDDD